MTYLENGSTLTGTVTLSNGGLVLSSASGIQLLAGTPGVTTNKIYNVGGSLYFNGAALGGGSVTLTDDTTTNASYYPVMATTAGGSTLKTSSTKISFNPSNGYLSIDGGLTAAGPVEGSTFTATGGGFTADLLTLTNGQTPSSGDLSLKANAGNLYWNGTNLGGGISYATPVIRNKYITTSSSNSVASVSVTAGDYIIVMCEYANSLGTQACSDNASGGSNTYSHIGSGHYYSAAFTTLYVHYAKAKATETLTITTADGGNTAYRLGVVVVTGLADTSPLDTYAWSTTETAGSTHVGPSITTTNANDYLLTWWAQDYASVTAHVENGTGFTIQNQTTVTMYADKNVTSTGTYYQSITTTGSSTIEHSVIMAFKAAQATTTSMLNPMVNAGDMIIGGSGGNPLVLPKGTDTNVLTMVSGVPAWASAGASSSPMTTLGDTTYYSTTPTRLAGNTTTRQKQLVQTGTGTVSAAPQWVNTPAVIVTGMDSTGATDSTAAIDAVIAALPTNGGVIQIPDPGAGGHYKFNLVITKSGIRIIGPGMGPMSATVGDRSCRPYDTTKPVIQVGNDTVLVSGVSVEEFSLYGNSLGQYGLFFAGGAYKCTGKNLHIASFLTTHFAFTNADVVPCSFNTVYNLNVINGSTPGCIGILYEDKHTSGGGWTTACNIIGVNSTTSYGYSLVVDSCSSGAGYITGGDLQATVSGHGLVYKNTYANGANLSFQNVGIDGINTGNYAVAIVAQVGVDAQSNGSNNLANYGFLYGSLSTNDKTFIVAGTVATCSIAATSPTLTVSSAANLSPGRYVIVPGAGTSYTDFVAKIVSISGTTVTLDQTTVNASGNISALGVYTAGNVTIKYGDLTGSESKTNNRTVASTVNLFELYGKNGLNNNSGLLYQADGAGSVAPWTTSDFIFDTGTYDLNILTMMSPLVPSSITQSGTTVTVTCSSNHYLSIGDIFSISGALLKDGINGTWKVVSRPSSTVFTYTSTASFTGTITGTFLLRRAKQFAFTASTGTFDLPHTGLALQNQSGVVNSIIVHDVSSPNQYFGTADPTSGILNIWSGTGITTGDAFVFGSSSANKLKLTGNGVVKAAPSAAPSADASFGQLYFATADSKWHVMDTAGGDVIIGSGGSVTLTNDTTTNATYYPVVATTAGGSTLKTSSTQLSFNPSTGRVTTKALSIAGTGTSATPTAPVNVYDTVAGYLQTSIQNLSTNVAASSDYVATTDTGSDSAEFIDMGINNSTFTGSWGGPKDGYLYVNGGASGVGDLVIGTQQASTVVDINVGGGAASNRVVRFDSFGTQYTAIAAEPSTPAAGFANLYFKNIGGRVMPKWVGPAGVDTPFQAFLGMNSVCITTTGTGTSATTVCTTYGAGFTAGGTGTITYAQTTPATGSLKSRTRLSTLSAAATAGNLSYVKSTTVMCAAETGYFLVLRFGLDTMASGNRGFFGLWGSATALTNVDVVTVNTARIGLAFNLNTGNWQLVRGSGSATTAIDLGATFPLNTTDLMELILFCAPGSGTVSYRVTNMTTAATTSGDLTTNIPASTTYCAWHMWLCNNATAGIVKWSFKSAYLETDY